MSYEAHKVIDKEFEEMINDVCGPKSRKLGRPKGTRPTPDFYDLPIYHEDFMKWWKERDEERYSPKISAKCNSCGEEYTVYTEPMIGITYNDGDSVASSRYEQYQTVHHNHFHCYKCGRSFVVTGSKILKIKNKSNQLEVVL